MVKFIASLLASLLMPSALLAGSITLTSLDGSLAVEGELLYFDGEVFRLQTPEGTISIESGGMRCVGIDCPSQEELAAYAIIEGPAEIVHRLMPAVLTGFAQSRGWDFRNKFISDSELEWTLTDQTGGLMASMIARVVSDKDALANLMGGISNFAFGRSAATENINQTLIALDGLVPVVASDNPLVMVTTDQLGAMLRGQVTNWSELGGTNAPISLHLPKNASLLAPLQKILGPTKIASATTYKDLDQLSEVVAANQSALGLLPVSSIGNTTPLVIGGDCGLASPATWQTIKSRDYPLTQPLFLFRNGSRQHRTLRDLLAYARGDEGQKLIRGAGFVDLSIERMGFEHQGDRLSNAMLAAGDDSVITSEVQRLIRTLLRADRLSVAFRFQDSSSQIDVRSVENIQRLARAILSGRLQGELIFVGFSDGTGEAEGNVRLSRKRAQAIRDSVASLVTASDAKLTSLGFGEIMPLACEDADWGREINRRVEVWLR